MKERRKRKELGNIAGIQITSEKVILKVPHKNIVNEIDNVASFDSKTKKLISTGMTPKEFQENYPAQWNKYQAISIFKPLFDSTSFDPEAVMMFLWTWWNEDIRRSTTGWFLFRYQTKDELNISFEGYEVIPSEKQREFEFLVSSFLHVKRLTINNKEKPWKRKDNIPGNILNWLSLVFVLAPYILFARPLFSLIDALINLGLPDVFDYLIFFVMGLVCLFISLFVGSLIGTFLWILVLKPFFTKEILSLTCAYRTSTPKKYYIFKIDKYLAKWLLGINEN